MVVRQSSTTDQLPSTGAASWPLFWGGVALLGLGGLLVWAGRWGES